MMASLSMDTMYILVTTIPTTTSAPASSAVGTTATHGTSVGIRPGIIVGIHLGTIVGVHHGTMAVGIHLGITVVGTPHGTTVVGIGRGPSPSTTGRGPIPLPPTTTPLPVVVAPIIPLPRASPPRIGKTVAP